MPCAEAIAEKTALFDDMCRRLHRVVLEPCEQLFQRPRAAPGKEEVLDNIDGAEDCKGLSDVVTHESLHGQR